MELKKKVTLENRGQSYTMPLLKKGENREKQAAEGLRKIQQGYKSIRKGV